MSDKLREAFEREYELSDHDKARDDEGCYHDMAMESAFTHFQAGHAHAIKFATGVIESHRVPIGNSPAGEMACDWTLDALKEVRDKINGQEEE